MFRYVFIRTVPVLCVLATSLSEVNLEDGKQGNQNSGHELSKRAATMLARRADLDQFKKDLDRIHQIRVPGSRKHAQVRKFIIDTMESLGWSIEATTFRTTVPEPFYELPFTNIIATLDPLADKTLVLACHYDSKYFPKGKFYGATDSAVPCAMLLNIARALQDELKKYKNPRLTLQFIFFDGEEAIKRWSNTDSIYGARHLAKEWSETPWNLYGNTPGRTMLDRIELFVLLDLLGTANPTIPNYFDETKNDYKKLSSIENRLKQQNLLLNHKSQLFQGSPPYFGDIMDDHTPFLKRGVRVLHVIPHPFPTVWHELSDNKNALNYGTIENLNRIFRQFVAEYLHL